MQLVKVQWRDRSRTRGGGEKRNSVAIRRTNAGRSGNSSELKIRYLYFSPGVRADRARNGRLIKEGFGRDRYGLAITADAGAAATVDTGGAPAV